MRELDLEVAGEFILMAATLIQIKVRMLLPRHDMEEEESEEDPRTELVRQLLEYKRYKEVAEIFMDIESLQRRFFPRACFDWEREITKSEIVEEDEILKDISLFDLLTAFKKVLDNMPKITSHNMSMPSVGIEDQIGFLLKAMSKKKRIAFSELLGQLKDRIVIMVTFIALLEMIRTHKIRIHQASVFGEIWISEWKV